MGTAHARPFAAHRRTTSDKVHRRTLRLHKRAYTVLSLRPGTSHRYSTNLFHETWHIVTDAGSALYLGRLLWALSFQKRDDTVLVVDEPFLLPNPFDAEPSRPFVFVNRQRTPFGSREARALGRHLPIGARSSTRHPDGTVVMNSRSRVPAIDGHRLAGEWLSQPPGRPSRSSSVFQVGGVIVFALEPGELRELSAATDRYTKPFNSGSAIAFAAERSRHMCVGDGEIQVLTHYQHKVKSARRRRAELYPGRGTLTEQERQRVW